MNLENDDENFVGEENDSGEFHPIACFQCRRSHKKCDKTLPECIKCCNKGLKCIVGNTL